jgi:hypothetical protein
MSDLTLPILPYAGASGWSGTETSRKRATDEDAQGITTSRQREAYGWLKKSRYFGMTWRDLSNRTGWHHGNASGVLSVLHKSDLIIRLEESRVGSKVYVLPDYVDNRAVSPRKERGLTKNQLCKAILAITDVDGNLTTDSECLDQILELVQQEMRKL